MIGKNYKVIAWSLIAALILSGCETQQQTGQLIGSSLGILCALGAKNDRDRAACLAIAAVGFIIGGEIGRRLDARDRRRREEAVAATLANDDVWRPRQGPQPFTPAELQMLPVNQMPPDQPEAIMATKGWIKPDQNVKWKNPDTQNSDRIEPLRDYTSNGAQCRQFRETYYRQGQQPVAEASVFCKDAQGAWKERST